MPCKRSTYLRSVSAVRMILIKSANQRLIVRNYNQNLQSNCDISTRNSGFPVEVVKFTNTCFSSEFGQRILRSLTCFKNPPSLLPFPLPLPLPQTPIRNPNTPHNLLRTIDTGTFCHQHCLTKKNRATPSPEHPSPASQLKKKAKKKVNSLLKRTPTRPKHLHQAPQNPQRLHRHLLRHPHVGQGIRKRHPESDPFVPEFEFAGVRVG